MHALHQAKVRTQEGLWQVDLQNFGAAPVRKLFIEVAGAYPGLVTTLPANWFTQEESLDMCCIVHRWSKAHHAIFARVHADLGQCNLSVNANSRWMQLMALQELTLQHQKHCP